MTNTSNIVGYRFVSGDNGGQSGPAGSLPIHVLYPSVGQAHTFNFGPYELSAVADCAPVGGGLPLIMVSHGNGGTCWAHRDLAKSLAAAGFMVGMVDHIGNCFYDNSLAGTEELLARRPAQLSAAIDAILADRVLGQHVQHSKIGVVGTSFGAYTALCLAGGNPWSMAHESPTGMARPVSVTHRHDLAALALLSPALFWFLPDGTLENVHAPIFVRRGDADTITPPDHTGMLRAKLPPDTKVFDELVPNAGHFSFMSAFPDFMVQPDFEPAHDPEGFDRLAYQSRLHQDVEAFFRSFL